MGCVVWFVLGNLLFVDLILELLFCGAGNSPCSLKLFVLDWMVRRFLLFDSWEGLQSMGYVVMEC